MRPQDKKVFQEAAGKLQLWILVRRTNPESLKYIGVAGYTPKPLDCKPKTADVDCGGFTLAGLVVDPTLHGQSFKSPDKRADAEKYWREFRAKLGADYQVEGDRRSKHFGVVKRHGKYVHGDYDLYDIIDPRQPQRNLAAAETMLGQPHRRGPNLVKVAGYVNGRIGVDMIQHGGEAQYKGHSNQAI